MKLFIVLALFAASVSAQDRHCPTQVNYDRFKDETVEICSILTRQPNSLSLFNVTTNVRYLGQTRHLPIKVTVLLLLQRGELGVMLSPEFDLTNTLYLLSDSDRTQLTALNPKPSLPGRDMLMEAARAEISAQAIKLIINAKTLEGRIGVREFELTPEELKPLQTYLKELDLILDPPQPAVTPNPTPRAQKRPKAL